jgi:hypothetical protein
VEASKIVRDPVEALLAAAMESFREKRSQSQMTLGSLIARLKEMAPDAVMERLCSPHSYRGYYTDLAFGRFGTCTAQENLETVEACMHATFVGYKGGEFLMDGSAPVWIARCGCTGPRLMAIGPDGSIVTSPEDFG